MRLMQTKMMSIFYVGLAYVLLCHHIVCAKEQETSSPSSSLKTSLKEKVKDQKNPFEKKISPAETSISEGTVEDEEDSTEASELPITDDEAASIAADEESEELSAAENDEEAQKVEEKNIFLNFDNTELLNFVNYIAELKQFNIIPDKSLEGVKVSLTIRHPLTVDGAWRVFLTVIEMAGFSIAEVGDVHKIVPKDQSSVQPLPSYINVPVDTLPESDLTIRYVVFLENIAVKNIEGLLQSMLSDKSKIFAHEDSNGFVITDKSHNIRTAIKLLQELDASGQMESVVVMKLKNVNATDVKELLTALIKDESQQSPLAKLLGKSAEASGKYFPPGTRIIAEERTNSLILLGLAEVIKKIESFIVENVDTQLKGTESPLHIYELQYTDAKQIAEILQEVIRPPEGGPGQQAHKYGAVRSGVKYFKSMNFGVDTDGNRLIVSSTDAEDWELLKKTIQDLDKPQPQVAVETLFVSITANDLKELGGSLRNKQHGQLGNIDFQSVPRDGTLAFEGGSSSPISLLGNMLNQIVDSQGASILTFGKKNNIWGVFQSVKQVTNASLLSQPFMTIANKTKATLSFGSEQRVEQETGSDQRGFVPVRAETKVEVEPQINLDGVIRLDININIDDFTSDRGDRQQRALKTNVTIADGQVLILGGFIQTRVNHTKTKTPLLGDIPVLGWMFKNEKKTVDETYIFIFMAPNIIKPRTLPGMGLYTRMKLHQATDQIERGVVTAKTNDPVFDWYFNPDKVTYSHKVIDYANARYQPTTVDIKNDPYYRTNVEREMREELEDKEQKRELPVQEVKRDKLVQTQHKESVKEMAEREQQAVDHRATPAEPKLVTSAKEVSATPTPPQENVQDAILKKLQSRRREVMDIDTQLEQRRERLKNTIAQAQKTEVGEQKAEHKEQKLVTSADIDKRNRLKEFLSKGQERSGLAVDESKRAKLKEFLSQDPVKPPDVLAQHSGGAIG